MTALAPSVEEFKNDEVRVLVRRSPHCRVELEVHVPTAMLNKARKAAIKSVSKEVVLPGFRKGKAPEEMILNKYSSHVDKEQQQKLADLAYVEAQKLVHIPLLNNNSSISFQMKKQTETDAELTFNFETEPTVPSVDPKTFEPQAVERPEVSDKQVDEAIHQMRFYYAQWTPVEDRPIQDGDYIMIDLDTIDGDTPQRVFNQVRFEVSKERMAAWMQKLVSGAKSGDVLEGLSEADDTATEKEKEEFKPKKIRLTIVKVEEAALPELNDEFAQKVGAPDVATMRKSVTELLQARAEEKVQDDLHEQVNNFLIEQYIFDLPQSLIDTEKKHRFNQLINTPKFKNNWQKMSAEERTKVEENLIKESSQAVRLFYLSRKIVNDAKISITHKEIQDEAIATMRSHGTHNADTISKEIYALALSKVILAKAHDYILRTQKA